MALKPGFYGIPFLGRDFQTFFIGKITPFTGTSLTINFFTASTLSVYQNIGEHGGQLSRLADDFINEPSFMDVFLHLSGDYEYLIRILSKSLGMLLVAVVLVTMFGSVKLISLIAW